MNVVVAGRVSMSPDDDVAGCVLDVPVCAVVPVWGVEVPCPAALDATATVSAAAIITRFSIRTSASKN